MADLFADAEFPTEALQQALLETGLPLNYEVLWMGALGALKQYCPPAPSLKLAHADRKWEVVSAYQKSVRRGDTATALRLVSAMCSLDTELSYFWRRVCTTACEDVGPGDAATMNFVIVASTVFTPKKTADYQYRILCFLTEMMCATTRSRAYCSLSIIEGCVKDKITPLDLTIAEQIMVEDLKVFLKSCSPDSWAVKNDWRGEGMLKYQILVEQQWYLKDSATSEWEAKEPALIKGLPEYAYDMHTRVGKGVLIRTTGFKIIKDFFAEHPTLAGKDKALGYAMFFEEGGLISEELYSPALALLEQKFVAAKFGYDLPTWMQLRSLMCALLADGAIWKLRERVASEQPY